MYSIANPLLGHIISSPVVDRDTSNLDVVCESVVDIYPEAVENKDFGRTRRTTTSKKGKGKKTKNPIPDFEPSWKSMLFVQPGCNRLTLQFVRYGEESEVARRTTMRGSWSTMGSVLQWFDDARNQFDSFGEYAAAKWNGRMKGWYTVHCAALEEVEEEITGWEMVAMLEESMWEAEEAPEDPEQ